MSSSILVYLRQAGLMGRMIATKFLRRRIAPLQEHERAVWDYSRATVSMKLGEGALGKAVIAKEMGMLFAEAGIAIHPEEAAPLYRLTEPEMLKILAGMPSFDEWGIRPPDLVGKQENLLFHALISRLDGAGPSTGSTWLREDELEDGEVTLSEEGSDRPQRRGLVVSSDEEMARQLGPPLARAVRRTFACRSCWRGSGFPP
jgi:hypothetical protein